MTIRLPASSLLFALLITLFAVMGTGMGTLLGSQGIIVAACGGLLLLFPPVSRPPLGWVIGISLLALTFLLQLMPGLGPLWPGDWREPVQASGIEIGHTPAAMPLLATEGALIAVAMLAWTQLALDLRLNRNRRKWALRLIGLFVSILAFISLNLNRSEFSSIYAPEAQVFSLSANPNQTGLVFSSAALVCVLLSLERFSANWRWAAATACAGSITILGLSAIGSRSALFLFCLGMGLWLCVRLMRVGNRRAYLAGLTAVPVALIIGGGIALFSSHDSAILGPAAQGDAHSRLAIYSDAVRMSLDQPVLGVGLKHFQYVFPQYWDSIQTGGIALHPESDWLWAASEMGLLGLTAIGFCLVSVVRSVWLERRHLDLYARIALFALIPVVGQSFVDVSMHRMGTFMLAAFLLGLVMSALPARPGNSAGNHVPGRRWLLRGGALLLILAGLGHSFIAFRHGTFLDTEHTSVLQVNDRSLAPRPDEAARRATLERALWQLPLYWRHHFMLARLDLSEGDWNSARSGFRRARTLEPNSTEVALAEAELWLPYYPSAALNGLRAAVLERLPYGDHFPTHRLGPFLTHEDELFQAHLEAISRSSPMFRVELLTGSTSAQVGDWILAEIAADPGLQAWSKRDQKRLFRRLLALGEAESLLAVFHEYPGLRETHCELYLQTIARLGEYKAACIAVRRMLGRPPSTSYGRDMPVRHLRNLLVHNNSDFAAALALYARAFQDPEQPDLELALWTTSQIAEQRELPAHLLFWQAYSLTESARFREAWTIWARIMASQPDNAWCREVVTLEEK